MKTVWAICKRELLAFYVSPLAWIVLTAWLLWSGLTYYLLCRYFAENMSQSATDTPLVHYFGGTMLFYIPLLFFAPVLTMRLIAGERRTGTVESLLTAPVTAVHVVFGKYLAAMVFWATLWLPSLLYVWITSRYGSVDMGAVASSYVGIFGIGLYYMAIGLWASARANNEIVAAILGFGALGGLFALGIGQFVFGGSDYAEVFSYLSVLGHMDAFAKGLVDSRYLVFDLSLTVVALYFAVRAVDDKRGAQ